MMKVFLGGTCNGSDWREQLIPLLNIDYFNPVVPEWTEEAFREELAQREHCDYCLYVITPKLTGVYSIAEVVDDSNKRPTKTIFCYLPQDDTHYFNEFHVTSFQAVGALVEKNGAKWLHSLEEVADYLNASCTD